MLLKTVLFIYPNNDKQNTVIKVYLHISKKWVFLEISQISQENTCTGVSFLINFQAFSLQLYLNRGSSIGVFLQVLQIF